MDDSKPIEYRFLNMDTREFTEDQGELVKQLRPGALLRALENVEYNQVLIAGGMKHFSEVEARMTCQVLTGVLNR